MRFQVLGGLQVFSDDGGTIVLPPAARRAVCVLIVHAEQRLRPDHFSELLWDTDGRARTESLKRLISEVRRALTSGRVPHSRGGYQLRLSSIDSVDLFDFRDLVKRAREEEGRDDYDRAADLYRDGLALWPEHPLEDLPTTTALEVVAAGLLAERQRARERFAEVQLRLGRHEDLLPLLRQWVAQDPLNELLVRQLLLALYRGGYKAQALHQMDQVQETLRREVNADPGPALIDMWERIKADDAGLTAEVDRLSSGSTSATLGRAAAMGSWWAEGQQTPTPIEVNTPNVARIYDYFLGGKDNFEADRDAAEKVIALMPGSRAGARVNRAFLVRAVRYLVEEAGIRQFLDLGAGLPTQGNVHEIALAGNPDSRVVYVDYDPVVCAHSRALLPVGHNVGIVQADLRQPESIVEHPITRRLLDFSKPVAVMMVSILHFVADEDDPHGNVAQYRELCAPGSYLAISHLTGDRLLQARPKETELARQVYSRSTAPVHLRTRDQIQRMFAGYELVGPGLTWLNDWRPETPLPTDVPGATWISAGQPDLVEEALGYGGKIPAYAGVGRKSKEQTR